MSCPSNISGQKSPQLVRDPADEVFEKFLTIFRCKIDLYVGAEYIKNLCLICLVRTKTGAAFDTISSNLQTGDLRRDAPCLA